MQEYLPAPSPPFLPVMGTTEPVTTEQIDTMPIGSVRADFSHIMNCVITAYGDNVRDAQTNECQCYAIGAVCDCCAAKKIEAANQEAGIETETPRVLGKQEAAMLSSRVNSWLDTLQAPNHLLRVLLVHGTPLVRLGLQAVFEQHGMQVIGAAADTEQMRELCRTEQPDVIVLDGTLTFVHGEGVISAEEMVLSMRQVFPFCQIFILVPEADEESLFQFLKVGAAAYELDRISPAQLVQKVGRVARGEYLITGEVLPEPSSLIEREAVERQDSAEEETKQDDLLTRREIEVLQAVMLGLSNKEISQELHISDQTVKNHLTTILRKLEAKDRTAAVTGALRRGLLSLSDVPRLQNNLQRGRLVERTSETALTSREILVLQYVARGWGNTKIGRKLLLSTAMVQNAMASVKNKLGVQERTEAVLKARHLGILPEEHQEMIAI